MLELGFNAHTPAKIALLLALGLAAACSPYVYKREINAFATGVENVSASHSAALAEARRLRLAEQRRQWILERAELAISPGCIGTPDDARDEMWAEDRCVLNRVDGEPLAPSATEVAARQAVPIAEGLTAYAQALKAITNAEDRATLDAATAELTGAIAALAPEGSRPEINAAGGLLSSLFGAYLDRRRLDTLRSGVGSAQPHIALLAPRLGESLDTLRREAIARRNANVARILDELNELGDGVSADAYAAHLAELEEETTALEALRLARPRETAIALVTAHEALRRALADDNRQIEAVVAAIQQFYEQVEKVEKAFS